MRGRLRPKVDPVLVTLHATIVMQKRAPVARSMVRSANDGVGAPLAPVWLGVMPRHALTSSGNRGVEHRRRQGGRLVDKDPAVETPT